MTAAIQDIAMVALIFGLVLSPALFDLGYKLITGRWWAEDYPPPPYDDPDAR